MNNLQTFQPVTFQLYWLDQFQSYLENDLRKVTKRQLGENSIDLAVQHIRVFSLWYEVEFNQPFNKDELVNYHFKLFRKHSLDEAKVTAPTWNSRLWALKIFCQWLGLPEMLDGIEAKAHGAISERNRSMDEKEYHDLIIEYQKDIRAAVTQFDYFQAVRNYAFTAVMLECGLRVAECAALDVTDIKLTERSGYVYVRDGKGGKERKVPMMKREESIIRPALETWMSLLGSSSTTALFTGKATERLDVRSMERIVKDMTTRIGSADITCHCLRYTFAKRLQRKGIPIEEISRLLGHSSITVTQRYLRSSLAELQSMMDG